MFEFNIPKALLILDSYKIVHVRNQTTSPNIHTIQLGGGHVSLIKIDGLCCLSTMFLVWEVVGCIWITQVDDDTFFCKRNIETSHNSIHQKGGEKAKQKKNKTPTTKRRRQSTTLSKYIATIKFSRTINNNADLFVLYTEFKFPVLYLPLAEPTNVTGNGIRVRSGWFIWIYYYLSIC